MPVSSWLLPQITVTLQRYVVERVEICLVARQFLPFNDNVEVSKWCKLTAEVTIPASSCGNFQQSSGTSRLVRLVEYLSFKEFEMVVVLHLLSMSAFVQRSAVWMPSSSLLTLRLCMYRQRDTSPTGMSVRRYCFNWSRSPFLAICSGPDNDSCVFFLSPYCPYVPLFKVPFLPTSGECLTSAVAFPRTVLLCDEMYRCYMFFESPLHFFSIIIQINKYLTILTLTFPSSFYNYWKELKVEVHLGGVVCLAWILQVLLQLLYVIQQFYRVNHLTVIG